MRRFLTYVQTLLLIMVLMLGWAYTVKADVMILTSPSQFSGSETLLTFEGVQVFENVTIYQGVHFQQVGADPGTGLEGAFDPSPPREFGPAEGTIIHTLLGGLPTGAAHDVQITFPSTINRLGFELKNVTPGEILIKLYSSGVLVESFTLPARGPNEYFFYGFETNVLFDQAVLRGPGDLDRRIVMDNLRFEIGPETVQIDIKPGSFPNAINPSSKGKVPVAILTTGAADNTFTFDATTVDPTSVLFGSTGAEAAPVHYALEDIDADGDIDLILHFNTLNTGIKCGDISATLTGETFDGQAIKGTDSIKTVGCEIK